MLTGNMNEDVKGEPKLVVPQVVVAEAEFLIMRVGELTAC